MERLEAQFETRRVGLQQNLAGALVPIEKTFIIGHGQQLARQRADTRREALGASPPSIVTRQQRRRLDVRMGKMERRAVERDLAAAALAAAREAAAPGLKNAAERRAKTVAARQKPHPHGHRKFMHRAARERAIAADIAAMNTIDEPVLTKKPRARKPAAA